MLNITDILDQELKSIEKGIQQAKTQRDEAATPMESHSDQTRQLADQVVQALQKTKDDLLHTKANLKLSTKPSSSARIGSIVEIENTSDKTTNQYFIVPEGLGGKILNKTTLLGNKSPLGKRILGKKVGHLFEINGAKFVIKEIISPPLS